MASAAHGDCRIKCFTWNVGNAEPKEEELTYWLPDSDAGLYDIIVVGTQENAFKVGAPPGKKTAEALDVSSMVDLQADSGPEHTLKHQETQPLPLDAPQGAREKDARLWDNMVARRLGDSYSLVKQVVLWEMRLAVYAKTMWVTGPTRCISAIRTATSATGGPGGLLGNKGGLVVKLNFRGTTFAFISCHLAAHSPQLAKRNQNCQEILAETSKSIGERRRVAAVPAREARA